MLLLHVSDTHLGSSRPLGHSRSREMDFYDVFDEVVEIAITERVDTVLHCGDFFDSPEPRPRAYYYAVRSLRRLSEAGIPFLVVAGQHDQPKRAEVSPLRVLEEMGLVKVLALAEPETRVVKLRSGELGVSALPYAPPDALQLAKLRRPDSRRKVLAAHVLLRELGLPRSHVSLAELGAHEYDYVALGDYHLRYSTSYGGVPAVYPGSTEALDILEAGDERYVVLVDLGGDFASPSWVKLTRFRRMLKLEGVASLAELQRALKTLQRAGKPPILYLELSEGISRAEGERVAKYLRELVDREVVLAYRLVLPEGREAEGRAVEEPGRPPPTLDQVVYELVKDPEASEFLLRLIKGSDSEETFKRAIEEALGRREFVEKVRRLVEQAERAARR